MRSGIFTTVLLAASVTLGNDSDLVDSLLNSWYQDKPGWRYECFSVGSFPFFVTDEPRPPLRDRDKHYTRDLCAYYKFRDREGTHLVIGALGTPKTRSDPSLMTYRLFFYVNTGGGWAWEMEPIVARFRHLGHGQYEPILNEP